MSSMLEYISLHLFQYVEAVENYREVLRSVEEHKNELRTDELQQLHAMYNLQEILNLKPKGIHSTLRDSELEKQVIYYVHTKLS